MAASFIFVGPLQISVVLCLPTQYQGRVNVNLFGSWAACKSPGSPARELAHRLSLGVSSRYFCQWHDCYFLFVTSAYFGMGVWLGIDVLTVDSSLQ